MSDQQRVTDILNRVEANPDKPIDERTIKEEITAALEVKPAVDPIVVAELIAFTLFEGNNPPQSGWPTYYGPEYFVTTEGKKVMMVELGMITADMVSYWQQRAQACNHPILKARYSGLAWDFKKVVGVAVPFDIARMNVLALIECVNRALVTHQHHGFVKLTRALMQSLAFKQADLTQQAVNAIMSYERTLRDEERGKFGFSYDLLIRDIKAPITDEQRDTIIAELEDRLARITAKKDGKKPDPWRAMEAASRLAEYYGKAGRTDDIHRVIRAVGQEYSELIEQSTGIQAYGWLQTLHRTYQTYGLKEEAAAALAKLREAGRGMAEELPIVSSEYKISKEETDAYVEEMLNGSYEQVLERIAGAFLPSKAEVLEQLAVLSKEAPMSFLFHTELVADDGRPIAKIKPLEDDEGGHVALHIARSMEFRAFFLHMAFSEGKARGILTSDAVTSFIANSAVVKGERLEAIKKGIDAYYSEDYFTSIHLLIPQIEEACRATLVDAGGNPWAPAHENGCFHLKTLDAILRDEAFTRTFTEDATLYFRILLTDQRGWNVRNNVCHGLWEQEMFTAQVADRLIHALLCLGLVRKTAEQEVKAKAMPQE